MNLFTNILLGAVLLLSTALAYTKYQNEKYKTRIDVIESNLDHYQDLASSTKDTNRVLQLTIDELKNSNDSIVQQMNKTIGESSIKHKNVTAVTSVEAKIQVSDTILIREPIHVDFEETIAFSDLTKVKVGRLNDKTYAELDITIPITIIYEEDKEYRNQYKNGWQRFWHFDWKKRKVRKFDVILHNKESKKGEVKVIEIIK